MNAKAATVSDRPEGTSRILVMRGGAVGDLILTLPALVAMRQKWPNAHVELAGYPHAAQLAVAGGLVDKLVSLDAVPFAQLFSPAGDLSDDVVSYIRSFDVILSWMNDPDGVLTRNLAKAGARRLVCGSPLVTDMHAIDTLMTPLHELGIRSGEYEYSRLFLSGQRVENGQKRLAVFGDRVVIIHPGSGSPKKNWPIDHFVALAGRLKMETELTPVFALGEVEEPIRLQFQAQASSSSARVAGMPPLAVLPQYSVVDLAAILTACAGYVGNDSGITHLAAAVGIPVIALFGPTDPRLWAPRGPNTTVIHSAAPTTESLAALSVNDVFAAAKEAFL